MKKTFLKKLLIGCSTALLFTYGIIFACADGGDWGIFYTSNYTPETFVDTTYSPLFLSQDLFYEDPMTAEKAFDKTIVQDWKNYLGKTIAEKDIAFFLLDSSETDVSGIYKYYTAKTENATTAKWKTRANLQNPKSQSFLEFLYLAQQVEKASVENPKSWYYDDYKKPYINNEKFLKLLEKRYTTQTDSFLKNRYWFQTMKAYFYSNFQKDGLVFFYSTEKDIPKNTLYYRALAYVAGIYYKQKEYAKSNYIYSIVFDKCKPLQMSASWSFHPQEEKDWKQSLVMAKTNEEKVALWGIQGYYGDGTKAIENIYALNPKSEYLDYLLSRIVNQTEQQIDNSFKEKSLVKYKKSTQDSILKFSKDDFDLIVKIANEEKTTKPYMWNMAAGYMQTLYGNYKEADTYFSKTENQMPKTPLAVNQLRLLKFINYLSSLDKITSKEEQKLNPDLNWLYKELPKEKTGHFRFENAIAWSQNYISALFHSQNNEVMAELFHREADFYENPNKLEKMKSFFLKQNKSEFEKIAEKVYSVKLDDIYEYQTVNATYRNDIDTAIDFIKKTDSIKYTEFLGNPFNGKIKDCHDCDHLAKQKRKYSYLDFLTTIKEMQQKLAQDEDKYNNCMLLGNAFYNITYYGNARIFYQGNILQYEDYYDYRNNTSTKNYDLIIDCSTAKTYYHLAFEQATNDEQRAKAQYMMAKCERNEWYNDRYKNVTDTWQMWDEKVNFKAWDGFVNLKTKYQHTQFYKECLNECGYFYTYITKKQPKK